MSTVITFDLSNRFLIDIPPRTYTFTQLIHLDLSCNRFIRLPISNIVSSLPQLQSLNLSHNNLSFFTDLFPLSRLRFLESLDISNNPFQSISLSRLGPERLSPFLDKVPKQLHFEDFHDRVKTLSFCSITLEMYLEGLEICRSLTNWRFHLKNLALPSSFLNLFII
ncbi:hypothetical protein GEMRC1_014060 [Eukaryota sp. GEM-RC1]